jgi:nucleoside phosphorylase/tetratricopeptide (TPR) repeat protein
MALTHDDYTVAWICALPLERAAAEVMLDKTHNSLPKPSTDPNAYVLGELNDHYIVVACLPDGIYGTISASTVMAHMVSTFPRVQFGLMVGIGGGVPSTSNDIRLGDVVVSKPVGRYSGVIQYDYGKTVQGGQFEPTGTLNKPPQTLLTHVAHLEARQMTRREDGIFTIVRDVLDRNPDMKDRFSPPNQQYDFLFRSSYHHADPKGNCEKCDKEQLVCRPPRTTDTPHIHYGLIASGDQVIKDSETRDRLAQQHGILCFEMEAAGLMDGLPTLVIRGISDYCDSHKQKEWQGYAALTAAAYAKLLLSALPVSRIHRGSTNNNSRMGHYMVSLGRNPRFVGRQNELTRLEELITMQDGPRKVAVTGLGGVGKTQVALELAYRIRDRDKECSIFWLACTSYGVIEQMYLNMAQALGLHDVNPAEVKEQVKRYLSSEEAGKWLLIFDNADDMDMWLSEDGAGPALKDFLPQSEQGRILFTTRNRKLAVELTSSNIIPIPDVDEDTALQILERSLVDKSLLQDHLTAVAVLEKLDFLPLAITQASAYINKNCLNLSTYFALLQEQEPEVVELLSEDFKDEGRYKDLQNPVITTWLISFKQIQRQDQLAADFLSFMACINPRNIPQSLLPAATSRKRAIDALGLLNAYAFTNIQDTGINLHRLVHIAARNWLKRNALFSHWIQRAADHMRNVFPDDNYTNRGLWREYLPHALSLVYEDELATQWKEYDNLIEKVADCLYSDGRYREAEVLYTNLIRTNQDEVSTLINMSKLVPTYLQLGQWKEAEKLQVQVLEIRKTLLGLEHPGTLTSMANLASTYQMQGRLNEAEKLEMQVLETSRTILGAEHFSTLTSMANLASTYWSQGRHDEAEKLEVQVLEMRKTILGAEHPKTLTSMANLASTYRNQGRLNEAEKLEVQALEKRKIILGAEHPDTLTSMANLASTYWKQARWDEAEKLGVQVVEISKTVLGDEHPVTLTSMGNLASTYQHQGQWDEAERLAVQVLEKRKIILGAEHPDTLTSMANLASTYQDQGRWDEAEKLGLQVTELSVAVLGAEHPDTLANMNGLASILKSQGKLQDALALLAMCSVLRYMKSGPDHPDTISSLRTLILASSPSERPPTEGSQSEGSQHPEIVAGNTAAALIAHPSCEGRIESPHTQRLSAAKSFLGDHPLLMASRRTSAERGGHDLEEID